MRRLFAAAVCALLAAPAAAGELISGTNAYSTEQRTWPSGLFAGYYMYDSVGEIEMHVGRLSNGPVECHGAGFWSPDEIMGEGVCIFGAAPNRWTVAFKMESDNKFGDRRKESYARRGTWNVVHATGKFVGMTGAGSFVAGPVVDGRKTTRWEGEIDLPW